MRLIFWLLGLPLGLVVVVFAIANRQEIHLDLWPLPFGIDLAAYLAVLAPLALGLVIGALLAFAASLAIRRRARDQRRRADSLERQLEASRSQAPGAAPPSP